MDTGTTIRFLKDDRHGDYKRRDKATITKVLAPPEPPYRRGIYVVKLEDGREFWTNSDDIEAWDQLSLF